MATRMANADGLDSDALWALCEAFFVSTTTSGSAGTAYQSTPVFTLPAGTYDGFALYVATNNATAGATITARLEDSGVEIAGTLVTINATDIPVTLNTDNNGSWLFFKFAAPVVRGSSSSNVRISALSSVGGVVSFYSSTGTTWARFVRSTSATVMGATDDAIIVGEFSAPGVNVTRTITMSSASATWGSSNTNSLTNPAIFVGNKGVFKWDTSAGARSLTLNGCVEVKRGGAYRQGNSKADAIPIGSSAGLKLNCTVAGDYGINVRAGGELCIIGTKNFSNPSNCYTRLNANLAANAGTAPGSVVVDDCTGWQVGDTIVFSSHDTSNTTELRDIAAIASGTSFSLTSNITNARFGPGSTSRARTVVANVSRNARVEGNVGATCYIYCAGGIVASTIKLIASRINYLGSGIGNRRGVQIGYGASDVEIENFCCLNGTLTSCQGLSFQSGGVITGASNYRVNGYIAYNIQATLLATELTTSSILPAWTIDRVCCLQATNGTSITIADVGGSLTNVVAIGSSSSCIIINEYVASTSDTGRIGTIANLEAGAAGGAGQAISIEGTMIGTISNIVAHQTTVTGAAVSAISIGNCTEELTIDGITAYSVTRAIGLMTACNAIIKNVTLTPGASPAMAAGFYIARLNNSNAGAAKEPCELQNVSIGAGIANGIQIVNFISYCAGLTFIDIANNATNKVSQQDRMSDDSFFQTINQDGVEGSYFVYKGAGTNCDDSAIFATAAPSLRMKPLSATRKLRSSTLRVPVQAGQTVTVTVKVRESLLADGADYNGSRARLLVLRDYLGGITTNTVVATATSASEGAFETLTASVGPVARQCILSFVVDCDGTTGFVNVDDFKATSPNDASGMLYADFDGTSEVPFLNSNQGGGASVAEINHPSHTQVIG